MQKLQKGDTIKCFNEEDLIATMNDLEAVGVETDFLYEKDGEKGLWLIVTKVRMTVMKDIERITEQIHELERAKFLLSMKDHWTRDDDKRDTELRIQIRDLKAQLTKLKELKDEG